MVAIEGRVDAFECAQILRDGPGGDAGTDYRSACLISQTMVQADLAWRKVLASETLADIRDRVTKTYAQSPQATRDWFHNARR